MNQDGKNVEKMNQKKGTGEKIQSLHFLFVFFPFSCILRLSLFGSCFVLFLSFFTFFISPFLPQPKEQSFFTRKCLCFSFFLELCCHSKFFPTRVALVQNIIPSYFRKKMLFRLLNRFGSNYVECAPITLL